MNGKNLSLYFKIISAQSKREAQAIALSLLLKSDSKLRERVFKSARIS